MKFNRAFSMAEMMVVMLIAAVVLAASAPMITKKIQRDQIISEVFDVLRSDENNAVEFVAGRNQRIFMNTAREDGYVGIVRTGVTIPEGSVFIGNNNVVGNNPTNSTAVGMATTTGNNATAIGFNSNASGEKATAVGYDANASGDFSIAMGKAEAKLASVAIGYGAKATGENSLALGCDAEATAKNSAAIGALANATSENTLVLGNSNTTVYIPGQLLVVQDIATVGKMWLTPCNRDHGLNGQWVLLGTDDYKGGDDNFYRQPNAPSFITDRRTRITFDLANSTIPQNSYLVDESRLEPIVPESPGSEPQATPSPSDKRLKNVGEEFKGGLEELSKLNFYHFTFKKDENKTPHVGVMAQDLQKVFPDAVTAGEDGYLRIRWDEMFYAVINAVKELNAKVCALAEDIVNLKNNDKTQDEKIAQLVENSKAQEEMIKSQAEIIKQQQEDIKKLCERVKNLER